MRKMPCKALFMQPMIRRNGDVTVCNYDITLELKTGNINESSLADIWYGEQMQKMRLNEILGIDIPQKCTGCIPDMTMNRRETIEYLCLSDNRQYIPAFLRSLGEKPKVLLINPLVSEKAPYKMTVSMGLGFVAAAVRKAGYHCEIIDMEYSGCTNVELAAFIERNSYTIAGITGMTYQGKNGLKLAETIKEHCPECAVCFGGVLASMAPDTILENPSVDYIIRGEGEESFPKLLAMIETGELTLETIPGLSYKKDGAIIHNPEATPINYAELHFADRDAMPTHGFIPDDRAFCDKEKGEVSVTVMFSRGCPGNCVFCASPRMWHRKMRYLPVSRMIEETKYLIYKYGVRNLVIDDDAFTVNPAIVEEFCEETVRENLNILWRCNTKVNFVSKKLFELMKKAGCIKVTYGVESGNDEILKIIQKHFTVEDVRKALALNKETGVPAGMLMIIGHPYETAETVMDSMNLVKELNPVEGWDFQVMQPHPGTFLLEELSKKTGKVLSYDWDDYFSDNITYLPESFSETEFLKICREVTGRRVKLAGKDVTLTYSELGENGCLIKIPPNKWEDAHWDEYAAFYWTGDDTCRKGFSHTLGKNHGFIRYLFENVVDEISRITVEARLCSQECNHISDVSILINDVECGTLNICQKSLAGEHYTLDIESQELIQKINLATGSNSLEFRVHENSQNPHGISILYRALEKNLASLEMPILIKVYSGREERLLNERNEVMQPGIPIPILIADIINRCNLKCVMCPQTFEHESRRGIMDFDLWKKIAHDICCSENLVCDCIFPFWNGEALLHPAFKEMISYLHRISKKHKSFNSIILHTNAALLTPEMSEFILETGLFGAITFSIDAMTSETYNKIRLNGDFDEVISNIHSFLILRERGEYTLPTVVFQFIVQEENAHEAESFYRYWKEYLEAKGIRYQVNWDETPPMVKDTIFIKRLITHDPMQQPAAEKLHSDTVTRLGIKPAEPGRIVKTDEYIVKDGVNIMTSQSEPVRMPCIGLWQNFSIRYDGRVSACCTDIDARMNLGNVNDCSIWNIWNGEKLKEYRIAHILGEFEKVPVCAHCKNQPFHSINDAIIEDYCRAINRPELYDAYRKRVYGI